MWTWGDELLPDLVLLDPAACVTMPAHVTTASGLDAFVHAMEAVTGRRAGTLVAAPALHALRLVLDHLPAAVDDGTDLDVRQAMQEAALLAGVAIDGGGTGIAHSIGHALGSLAHVPHGVAVAVGLAAAFEWNVAGAPDAFARRSLAPWGSRRRPSRRCSRDLARAAGLPAAVGRVGALTVGADEIAATMVAEENLPMYANNCRLADDTERAALADGHARHVVGVAGRGRGGRVTAIARIDISHHRLPLDPPFPASWDPRPRTHFPATIVRVTDDAGHVGIGSGDAMYGFADYETHFLGQDPLDLERHAAVLANIDFHAGRPWPLDVALWDLAGQIQRAPGVGSRRRARPARPGLRVVGRPPPGGRDGRRGPAGAWRWASRR